MSRRGWVLFTSLGIIWGTPYLFIRVAVEHLSPAVVVLGRMTLAVLLLFFGLVTRNFFSLTTVEQVLRQGAVLGIVSVGLTFVLLCGGLGAVLSFPVSSRLMASLGGRHTMLISGAALLLVLLGIGFAPSVPLLMMAVLMLGKIDTSAQECRLPL